MAVNTHVTADRFQRAEQIFEQTMFHFGLTAADAANQVVMVIARDLIGEMAIPSMRGADQSDSGEELQRSIDGGLGNARKFLPGQFVHFTGG